MGRRDGLLRVSDISMTERKSSSIGFWADEIEGMKPVVSFSFLNTEELDTDLEMLLGDQGSIGVLIMTSGSAEDRTIPDGPPTVAGAILAPSRFITWPNSTRLIESSGK